MKKILLMSFEYPTGKAYCGGVGQIVKQCRQALIGMGHEVYVLISSEFQRRHPVKLLLPDGTLVRYRYFGDFQKEHDLSGFGCIIQHFVNWTQELKKIKKVRGRNTRIVYHFHSILRREKDSGFKTFRHFLLNQEKMIEIADRIICPSRYEYDNFSRYFPSFLHKVVLVENTVESFPCDTPAVEGIKKKHGIGKEDIVSLYVGRLERIKGAHLLARDLPRLLKRHGRLKVFIVGKALDNGLYRKVMALQRTFPRQVFYIRYLEKKTLFQYYYLSHIYINTSLSESFSISTHESALCHNALLLNNLPVLDKFKGAAAFFDVNRDDFIPQYEYLIRNRRARRRISQKANRIARGFLTQNRLQEDLSGLFKDFRHQTASRL